MSHFGSIKVSQGEAKHIPTTGTIPTNELGQNLTIVPRSAKNTQIFCNNFSFKTQSTKLTEIIEVVDVSSLEHSHQTRYLYEEELKAIENEKLEKLNLTNLADAVKRERKWSDIDPLIDNHIASTALIIVIALSVILIAVGISVTYNKITSFIRIKILKRRSRSQALTNSNSLLELRTITENGNIPIYPQLSRTREM